MGYLCLLLYSYYVRAIASFTSILLGWAICASYYVVTTWANISLLLYIYGILLCIWCFTLGTGTVVDSTGPFKLILI